MQQASISNTKVGRRQFANVAFDHSSSLAARLALVVLFTDGGSNREKFPETLGCGVHLVVLLLGNLVGNWARFQEARDSFCT